MKLKYLLLLVFATITIVGVQAQSKTTETLQKKYEDALSFFFYNNTLKMLNQSEDKEFDELIKDIEKMRFLMINKDPKSFNYKKLVGNYKSESFEEVMTSRLDGKNFDIFIKENNGKTKGMLVLINDSTNLYVLDILGKIALDKVTKLYSTIDKSADIGNRIKAFTGDEDQKKKEEKKQ